MLNAKRYCKPIAPVAAHGMVNGALYGIVTLLIVGIEAAVIVFAIEAVTHTFIDVMKGRINQWFPVVEDNKKTIYWIVMGADQLLHQIVLIFIVSLYFF